MRATKWQQRWPISCLASSFTFLLFNAVSLWKRGYTLRCHCDQARMCHADCALLSYNSLSSSYILIAFAALFSFLLFFTVSFIALTGINGLDCTGLGLARTRAQSSQQQQQVVLCVHICQWCFQLLKMKMSTGTTVISKTRAQMALLVSGTDAAGQHDRAISGHATLIHSFNSKRVNLGKCFSKEISVEHRWASIDWGTTLHAEQLFASATTDLRCTQFGTTGQLQLCTRANWRVFSGSCALTDK